MHPTDGEIKAWFTREYGSLDSVDHQGRCLCFHLGQDYQTGPAPDFKVTCLSCGKSWEEGLDQ